MDKLDASNKDPLVAIASVVWLGVGMAAAFLFVGIPYLLLYEKLPANIQLWLGPRTLLLVAFMVGVVVTA